MSDETRPGAARTGGPSTTHCRLSKSQYQYVAAALATSLSTIGLVCFVYTPILPALIQAALFPERSLIALSSAALVGFLVGTLAGRLAATIVARSAILNAMNVCASLSLLACAFPVSLAWLFVWRLLGGLSGVVVVVLLGATIMPHIAPAQKAIVGGAIFVGIGIGILASATLVPLLLNNGLRITWLGSGTLPSVLTIVVWRRLKTVTDLRTEMIYDTRRG
jgi:MFS family permease